MKMLQNDFSFKAWKSLAETTLIIIQVFNRRRAGEIERTLINDYQSHKGTVVQVRRVYTHSCFFFFRLTVFFCYLFQWIVEKRAKAVVLSLSNQ